MRAQGPTAEGGDGQPAAKYKIALTMITAVRKGEPPTIALPAP